MKFKIEDEDRFIYVNGEKQTKTIKKVKLSDYGEKLNDIMKKVLEKKQKNDK